MPSDDPRCAWACDSSLPLQPVHGVEMGDTYFVCPCCAETTRVDRCGVAHRMPKAAPDVRDCQGHVMYDP